MSQTGHHIGFAFPSHDYSNQSILYNKAEIHTIEGNDDYDDKGRKIISIPTLNDQELILQSVYNYKGNENTLSYHNIPFNNLSDNDSIFYSNSTMMIEDNEEDEDIEESLFNALNGINDEDELIHEDATNNAKEDAKVSLEAREYQKELIQNCRKQNTIIVAPTGAGKTFIAALIIQEALQSNPNKKVVFLATQVPLVVQQAKVLNDFVSSAGTRVFYGDSKGDRKSLENWKDIKDSLIVCTPQILLNALNSSVSGGENTILNDIQLIIFDECHHCKEKHPYQTIMSKFYKPRKFLNQSVPRIIGLTASPSAKNTTGDTLLGLLSLCYNLDSVVRKVEKNEDDLKKFIYIPDLRIVSVDMDPSSETLKKFITNAVKCIKIVLLEKCSVMMDDDILGTEEVEDWISESFQDYEKKENSDYEDEERNIRFQMRKDMLQLLCQTLSILNECLLINEHRSPLAAWQTLLKLVDSIENREVLVYLDKSGISRASYERLASQEPIAIHCKKRFALIELLEKYKDSNENNLRILIFVKSRNGAQELRDFLMETETLKDFIKPGILLGHHNSKGNGPTMTQHKQKQVLNHFRHGVINTLISTSVGEEGLDIPACNVVIRMDGVDTTQNLIQSRGRARSRNSEFYCILHKQSGLDARIKRCLLQEKKMERAIDILVKAEKYFNDVYLRGLDFPKITGLKTLTLAHFFEFVWNYNEPTECDETIQKLFDLTMRNCSQVSILQLACEKLLGQPPIYQFVKLSGTTGYLARVYLKLNNPDRNLNNPLQASSYICLSSNSFYRNQREAKNNLSLDVLKLLLEKDLIIFPANSWSEIYKEKPEPLVIINPPTINNNSGIKQMQKQNNIAPVATLGTSKKSGGGKKQTKTHRITDRKEFDIVITLETAIQVLEHHSRMNFNYAQPQYKDFVCNDYNTVEIETKTYYKFVCSVKDPLGKVSATTSERSVKKKEAKKEAALKMCNAVFEQYSFIDVARHLYQTEMDKYNKKSKQ
ncbi:hypothetical protein ABK040_008995 [Willaertia magna]